MSSASLCKLSDQLRAIATITSSSSSSSSDKGQQAWDLICRAAVAASSSPSYDPIAFAWAILLLSDDALPRRELRSKLLFNKAPPRPSLGKKHEPLSKAKHKQAAGGGVGGLQDISSLGVLELDILGLINHAHAFSLQHLLQAFPLPHHSLPLPRRQERDAEPEDGPERDRNSERDGRYGGGGGKGEGGLKESEDAAAAAAATATEVMDQLKEAVISNLLILQASFPPTTAPTTPFLAPLPAAVSPRKPSRTVSPTSPRSPKQQQKQQQKQQRQPIGAIESHHLRILPQSLESVELFRTSFPHHPSDAGRKTASSSLPPPPPPPPIRQTSSRDRMVKANACMKQRLDENRLDVSSLSLWRQSVLSLARTRSISYFPRFDTHNDYALLLLSSECIQVASPTLELLLRNLSTSSMTIESFHIAATTTTTTTTAAAAAAAAGDSLATTDIARGVGNRQKLCTSVLNRVLLLDLETNTDFMKEITCAAIIAPFQLVFQALLLAIRSTGQLQSMFVLLVRLIPETSSFRISPRHSSFLLVALFKLLDSHLDDINIAQSNNLRELMVYLLFGNVKLKEIASPSSLFYAPATLWSSSSRPLLQPAASSSSPSCPLSASDCVHFGCMKRAKDSGSVMDAIEYCHRVILRLLREDQKETILSTSIYLLLDLLQHPLISPRMVGTKSAQERSFCRQAGCSLVALHLPVGALISSLVSVQLTRQGGHLPSLIDSAIRSLADLLENAVRHCEHYPQIEIPTLFKRQIRFLHRQKPFASMGILSNWKISK